MELSVRLARSEMNSMPSELMAPHVLIAMMTRRMLGPMSSYWWLWGWEKGGFVPARRHLAAGWAITEAPSAVPAMVKMCMYTVCMNEKVG